MHTIAAQVSYSMGGISIKIKQGIYVIIGFLDEAWEEWEDII